MQPTQNVKIHKLNSKDFPHCLYDLFQASTLSVSQSTCNALSLCVAHVTDRETRLDW